MGFTQRIQTCDIDLAMPAAIRTVIKKNLLEARAVVREARKDFAFLPRPVHAVFSGLYRVLGGLYVEEIQAWSKALRIDSGEATMLQCAYELSQAETRLLGCTAGLVYLPAKGMVHVRNMDWPLRTIGRPTRLFRFHLGERTFTAVGILGFVGILSGMLPGAYFVTLNWAPASALPRPHRIGAAFLLRDVLESCDTYAQALRALKTTPLSSSAFFTLCGTREGDACIIERVRDRASVRVPSPSLTMHTMGIPEARGVAR